MVGIDKRWLAEFDIDAIRANSEQLRGENEMIDRLCDEGTN